MTIRIQDLPLLERPRERFAQKGSSALSTTELIAILLGSGTKDHSALDLGATLLSDFGTLEQLSDATLQELLAIKGIKFAKAIRILAAFALGKRLQSSSSIRTLVDTPEKAFREISQAIQGEKTEVLYVLLRDARKRVFHQEIIGRGILNQVLMHPREIFHTAIRHRAHSVILGHNHPSGIFYPSTSDIEITQKLCSAGKVIGIPISDHLIVVRDGFYSFWEKGFLDSRYEEY